MEICLTVDAQKCLKVFRQSRLNEIERNLDLQLESTHDS